MNPKKKCRLCHGEDFELRDGHYFCSECGVQIENLIEMEHEEFNENLQTKQKVKIAEDKNRQKENLKARRLTSWEEYNFILIGLVNEILEIEEIPGFKKTCLQLWISYLRATEAAFFSKDSAMAPKLFAKYRKADAEILYNQKPFEKKQHKRQTKQKNEATEDEGALQRTKRIRRSEKIISQELSESARSESFNSSVLANLSLESIKSEHEQAELDIEFSKKGRSTNAKRRGNVPMYKLTCSERIHMPSGVILLNIIYCALNICHSRIQFSDLIRFVREGHLSYFNPRKFLPPDLIESDVPLSFQEFHSYRMISHLYVRMVNINFVKLIPDLSRSFYTPDIAALARRYVEDMQLPDEIGVFVERLINFLPPQMPFRIVLPNYEGRAISFVLFVLKLLFGVDGYREKQISDSARLVNRKAKPQQQIFVYEDWRKFIEYRQVILGQFYHPVKMFGQNKTENRPYLAFDVMLEALDPKTKYLEPQVVNTSNMRRMQSKKSAMEMCTGLAKALQEPTKFSFPPSMTPHRDYFQLVKNSLSLNQKIADVDHPQHSVQVFLDPKKFAADQGVEFKTKKATFPKCFAFEKPQKSYVPPKRQNYERQHENLEDWREKLENRRKMEAKLKSSQVEEFHQKQMERVLEKRALWRLKKKFRHVRVDADGEVLEDPQVFSDSEEENEVDEDEINCMEDPELERLFQNHQLDELTLVVPDFNVWQRMFYIGPCLENRCKEFENLPASFQWLLSLAATMLHQNPMAIYRELLLIEGQYMHVYEPVELMRNVLVRQQTTLKTKTSGFDLECDW